MHTSDDALLELALAGADGDPEAAEHVRTCVECSLRYAAVLAEQNLLRATLSGSAPPDALRRKIMPRRFPWILAGAAAAALLGLSLAFLAFRPGRAPSGASGTTMTPADIERTRNGLRAIVQELEDARDTLASPVDDRTAKTYAKLLHEKEKLYADALGSYLNFFSPLSSKQVEELRRIVHEFGTRAAEEADVRRLAEEYRARARSLLNDTQELAFEEYTREEIEWDRKNDIDMLTEDLAQEFDLRYSDVRKVREILEEKYPRSEIPMFCLGWYASDTLSEDSFLSDSVRKALDSSHHSALDGYLKEVRLSREESNRIAREYGSKE